MFVILINLFRNVISSFCFIGRTVFGEKTVNIKFAFLQAMVICFPKLTQEELSPSSTL